MSFVTYQLTKSLQYACSSSIQKWQINPCFSTGCCGWLRHLENHQRFIWACLCSPKCSKPCEHTEWILQQPQTWFWVSSTKVSNVLYQMVWVSVLALGLPGFQFLHFRTTRDQEPRVILNSQQPSYLVLTIAGNMNVWSPYFSFSS